MISLSSALRSTLFLQCLGISIYYYFCWILQARLILQLVSIIIMLPFPHLHMMLSYLIKDVLDSGRPVIVLLATTGTGRY